MQSKRLKDKYCSEIAFLAGNVIYFASFVVLCQNELDKVVILNSEVNAGFEKESIFEKIN